MIENHSKLDGYSGKKIEKIIIPYSNYTLERINFIFNVCSNFYQRIIKFIYNNFEITIWLEKLNLTPPSVLTSMDSGKIKKLFIQFVAVYEISKTFDFDFIRLDKFTIQPDNMIRFNLVFDKRSKIDISDIIKLFKKNKYFKDLDCNNYYGLFSELIKKSDFNEKNFYIYRFGDFASNILSLYFFDDYIKLSNIKINIQTENSIQKEIIKKSILHRFICDDIIFLNIEKSSTSLLKIIHNHFSETKNYNEDFVGIVNQMEMVVRKSFYRGFILLVEELKSKEEVEFIKYIMNDSQIFNVVLIVFEDNSLMEFDLVLKEKSKNLLKKYLVYNKNINQIALNIDEKSVLKIFFALTIPIPRNLLYSLFRKNEITIIQRLIKKKYLLSRLNQISVNTQMVAKNIALTEDEERQVLKNYINRIDLVFIKMKYYLKTQNLKEIMEILLNRVVRMNPDEKYFNELKYLLLNQLNILSGDVRLLGVFVEILIKERDLVSAKKIVLDFVDRDKIFFSLKLSYIHKLEKDYQKMKKILAEIKNSIKKELEDEYFYLNFVYFEKVSNFRTADSFFKKIKMEPYLTLANIQMSDRLIYKGEYKKAEVILKKAIGYLAKNHYLSDELEAHNHMAKLFREKGHYNQAENLYKNIYIKSEIKNYTLLSAFIAVDIGNLFLIQDDFKQAKYWYKKGINVFCRLKNKKGEILVESNLVEIYKIEGYWKKAENYLRSTLKFDQEKKLMACIAIDLYNIAHLEYLRRNYKKALEFIERAVKIFKEKRNINGIIESEILKLSITTFINLGILKIENLDRYVSRLNQDQKIIFSLFKQINKSSSEINGTLLLDKNKNIVSKITRFQMMVIFAENFKMRNFLTEIKCLSIELSKGTKNYFYYEYYWVFFNIIDTETEVQGFDKDIFIEMYYFFLRNKRKITSKIFSIKKKLDKKDSVYDFFKSAELVGDYLNWKIPEDFFKSFLTELGKRLEINLVKLLFFENGKQLFSFSNKKEFHSLGQEIINQAIFHREYKNLKYDELQKSYESPERFFYPYRNTKIIQWKISDTIFAILLLAFQSERYYNIDIFENYSDLFSNFTSLFQRYYEYDFKFNEKLRFIVGESKAIKQLKKNILKVSRVDFSILITGESGSGKELVAKAIHLLSNRSKKPFIPVNSAAIPENLLEAELFGYKKGAFTGANENRMGLIEAAHTGTLFLDEIADVPIQLQVKLLRILQEKEIRRLGENHVRRVDIRLIFATNKDLIELISKNQFREDLYFRIQDLSIHTPSLRDRIDDIPLLVKHFFSKYGFIIKEETEFSRIIDYFKAVYWKGNVRELESRIKRLITFYPEFDIDSPGIGDSPVNFKMARAGFEKSFIIQSLKENNWNKVKTARQLDISRVYLFDLIKKYGITEKNL